MAKQIEIRALRVTSANRGSITPKSGEFLYETDTGFVYIGNGSTVGGNVVSTGGGSVVSSVNGQTGVVTLNLADIPRVAAGGISSTNSEAALQEVFNSPLLQTYNLVCGGSNLLANGTEQMSWGNNAANDGVVIAKDCEVYAHSLHAFAPGAAGSAAGTVVINGVNQTAAGQQVVLDGNIGSGGETVAWERGFVVLGTPIQLSAGQLLHYRVITSAWSNTGTDVSVMLYMRDR